MYKYLSVEIFTNKESSVLFDLRRYRHKIITIHYLFLECNGTDIFMNERWKGQFNEEKPI